MLCCTSVRILSATTDDKCALEKAEIDFKSKAGDSQCLFPRLRCLKWTALSEYDDSWNVDYLLPRSLQQIWIVAVSSFNTRAFDLFGRSLIQRAPYLRVLKINAPEDTNYGYEEQALYMILALRNLSALYIPGFMVKDYLMEALLQMPRLYIVNTTINNFDGFLSDAYLGEQHDLHQFGNAPVWKSLTHQDVLLPYPFRILEVLKTYKFLFLTYLALNPVLPDDKPDSPRSLADLVASSFPSLQTLIIGSEGTMTLAPEETVVWKTILKILKCKNLTTLEIYSWRVSMTSANLLTLAKNRRTWRSVVIFTAKGFNFQDLLIFAEHCPTLEKLGLRFHGLSTIPVMSHQINPKILFPSLREMYFANTYVVEDQGLLLGLFLFVICERPLSLTGFYGKVWDFVESYIEFLRGFIRSPDADAGSYSFMEKYIIPAYKIAFLSHFTSDSQLCLFLRCALAKYVS